LVLPFGDLNLDRIYSLWAWKGDALGKNLSKDEEELG
jgi:hypothetical protein